MPKPDMDHLEIIRLLLDKGAEPERAGQGQHADPHHLHDAVVLRGRRHAVHPRGAVERHRADEAAARSTAPIRRSRRDYGDTALTACRRHRLGGRRHLRALRQGEPRSDARCCSTSASIRTAANNEGRTALMGAALKGRQRRRPAARRSRREARRSATRAAATPTRSSSAAAGHTWQALDYAEGLVRVGVQSAVARPETAALIRKLMAERGMPVPPIDRTILSICVVALCQGTCQ